MKITVYNYRFPFREDLGVWSIVWNELSGSEGYVRLQATISPNFNAMCDYMVNKHYLDAGRVQIINRTLSLGINIKLLSYGSGEFYMDPYTESIINGIIKFCESKTQIIKKRSFSWSAALDFGNTTRTDKCMKAIKKDLYLDGEETVYKQLLSYFKQNNIYLDIVY